MTNTSSIAQLQSDWFGFSDLDRAGAVLTIHQSGISIRKIAAQLHLSESLLRHLLLTLQAPACDQALARQGKISTSELVRRGKAGLHPATHDVTVAIDRDRKNRIAADLTYDWVLQIPLFGPAREMIIKEVQHKFLIMKEAGLHPSAVAPPDMPASEIIARTKPPALTDDRIDIVSWYAQWLYKWSFYAFPDEDIRDIALELARQKQARS